MTAAKTVILLAAASSYRVAAFTRAANALGLHVVQGLDVPPPFLSDSSRQLAVDYRDVPRAREQVARFVDRLPAGRGQVAAVVGLDDSGSLVAAAVAAELNLPHNDPAAAQRARDKIAMRRAFLRHDVPSTPFAAYQVDDDPESILDDITAGKQDLAFPVVLKPSHRAGSQGVMRADTPDEFIRRQRRLRRILNGDPCRDMIVENYIPGGEVALEGVLNDGQLQVLALFDKPDPLEGPFFEETIYTTPSRLPPKTQGEIAAAAAAAAAAIGLRTGPIHAELRVTDAGPVLLEVAARSIGGQCSRTLRFGTDLSLEMLVLRQALGEDVAALTRAGEAGGVMMIPIPRRGIYRGVEGLAEARAVPLIDSIEISARAHYPLQPPPEGDSYLGFIFASGPTPSAVEQALRRAHACLRFQIETPLRVLPARTL